MTTSVRLAIVDGMPDVNITDVPSSVLRKLNSEGKRRGVGMATIVTEAIAAAYDLDSAVVPESTFKGGATSPDSRLVVMVPDSVRDVLRREGPGAGSTIRVVVINCLAARYGLKRVPEGRQPRAA